MAQARIVKLRQHLTSQSMFLQASHSNLDDERAQASFVTRDMTHFLDGDAGITTLKEQFMADLLKYPELRMTPQEYYDQSFEAVRENTVRKVCRVFQLLMEGEGGIEAKRARVDVYALYDIQWHIRNGVHFGLFMGAIMGQGDMEQQARWMPPTLMCEIYGCFAMTELGHGSFLRGLETTATYDKRTQEFIINSPTETSTKFWIGAAGQTATHCVCYAQLWIDGENKGVHNFMVPLRDVETHQPLPGIRVGDCGHKMGLNGIDNGWIQFDHVRIPLDHMFCKYAKVAPDGTYSKPPKAQMAYGALIGTRGDVVMLACNMLKKALMISVRYSAIRRQGIGLATSEQQKHENKLLDYQSHQYRLMPVLAMAYAFHFQVVHVRNLVKQLDDEMANGSDGFMEVLADVHATMAGLKAFATWATQQSIEQCRQCCGGHGYSSYNGLASLVCDFAVMVTWEGDNTVMAQQTARYLISSIKKTMKGEKLSGSVTYLEDLPQDMEQLHWQARTEQDVCNPELQAEAFRYHVSRRVQKVALRLEEERLAGYSESDSWNRCQVDLINAARVHVYYNVASQFIKQTQELTRSKSTLAPILTKLCNLFVLEQFRQDLAFYLEDGFFSAVQAQWIASTIREHCSLIRKEAVPLVDAFNYTDAVLNSCIGRQDGNIYTHYLKAVSNRTNPTPYFESQIKPMLQGTPLDN